MTIVLCGCRSVDWRSMSARYIRSENRHAYKEQGHNKSLNADGVKEKINEVNIIQIACGT